MTVSARAIIDFLGDRAVAVRGDAVTIVRGAAPAFPGQPQTLAFISAASTATDAAVSASGAGLLLVSPERFVSIDPACACVAVEDPRREFARVVAEFFALRPEPGVSEHARIDASARIGLGCSIAAGVVIGPGVVIGDHCAIGANAVIHVSTIGDHTSIGPNATIGHTGFGYVREDDGTPMLMPHSGGVRIGSHVDIGANTCVDRGTLADTVIRDHAKVDNLVHVAHNVDIGEGAFIIATSILCGSVRIGDRAWIAPNASILEGLSVGDDAVVGLGAVVIKDVPAGATVVGNPAKQIG